MADRAEIFVEGRVQGVAYRAFTQKEARGMGLGGYCQNLADGRVLVTVEGDQDVIRQFIERLWIGPPHAKVTQVAVSWQAAVGLDPEFSIRW